MFRLEVGPTSRGARCPASRIRRAVATFPALVGTYASAIAITLVAALLGRGICALAGQDESTWFSPAVGFAALMVLCETAIGLPGRGWTAVAAVVVACAAAVWIVLRRPSANPSLLDGLVVAAAVLLFLSIPFLANGRVGLLGVSVNNDPAQHLLLAQGLRQPAITTSGYGIGYPLGPHAVAAVFAQGLGSNVEATLTGVLMATPMLIGLTALGALADISRSRRLLVAVLVAIPYLGIAWYIQSAFKEPILGLMLLGLVVVLQDARRDRFARPVAVLAPAAVLTAGVLYDYSYPGLLWPIAIVACWGALELVVDGGWRRLRGVGRSLRSAAPGVLVGLLVLLFLAAPDIGRIHTFWVTQYGTGVATSGGVTTGTLGNLAGPLRALEGLSIWLNGDFRFIPADALKTGALAGFAAVVLTFAVVSALGRRSLVWVGAVLALGLIYFYVKSTDTPYVAAKALVIPASLLVLGSGGELMRWLDTARARSATTAAVALAAIVFFVFSFQSSYLLLANAFVGPDNHLNELRSLRPLLHGRPTLALFYDDFVQWELLGVPTSSPPIASVTPAPIQPAKPWSYGQPLFFTSVSASTLNLFDYVITTRTTAATAPPPNFHLVGESRSYEVWQRVGPTRPFRVLPSPGVPGAILDCRAPAERRIARAHGFAMVTSPPRYFALGPLVDGASEQVVLHLPPGDWDVSLPFTSSQAVTVRGGGLNVSLPPNLDRPGSIWPVGRIRTTGSPVTLTVKVKMADPRLVTSTSQFFTPEPMVAVPATPPRAVPLHRACGRYVEWYELT